MKDSSKMSSSDGQIISEVDEEGLEIEEPTIRWKGISLTYLLTITKFSRREMRMLYQGFKQECPSGIVTEDVFKSIFARFFPQGDSSKYAHLVFKKVTATRGQKGKLNFEQFVTMLSSLSRGSPVEKLRWIFQLYDVQGDGYITRDEMVDVVSSIYELLGQSTSPVVEATSAENHVDQIFELMDSNQDGVITFDEFCDWCQKDERRKANLDMFDTIFL